MGAIQKQSLLFTLTGYVGLAISLFASLFIYPLDWATYGMLQFVIAVSQLLLPILTLGFVTATVKYYPEYKSVNKTGELLTLTALAIVSISSIFLVLYPWLYPTLFNALELLGFDVIKLENLQGSIFGIAVAGAFSLLLSTYITNYKKIFVPTVLMELSLKIILPLLIVLKVFGGWTLSSVISAFLIYNLLITLVLAVYMRYLKREKFMLLSSYTKSKIGVITEYSIFNMLNVLAYTLVYRLDIIMITLLLGETYTGYYSLLLFIANVIEIPGRGVVKITGPMVAKLIETKNLIKVKELYQKASINLMLICGIIGLVIYSGLEPLLSIVKDGNILIGYLGVWVLLVLGKWINQSTSLNSHIINYSEHFRWSFYLMGIQAVLNIILNYYLITRFGLMGAAIATTVSIILNNILKMLLVKYNYGMWPFNQKSIEVFLFLIGFSVLIYFTPYIEIPYLDIILRTTFCGLIMVYISYRLTFSEQLNAKINESLVYINKLTSKNQ